MRVIQKRMALKLNWDGTLFSKMKFKSLSILLKQLYKLSFALKLNFKNIFTKLFNSAAFVTPELTLNFRKNAQILVFQLFKEFLIDFQTCDLFVEIIPDFSLKESLN